MPYEEFHSSCDSPIFLRKITLVCIRYTIINSNERKETRMKLFHLSDLHLGKRVNGFSMIEDQKYIVADFMSCHQTALMSCL